MGQVMNFDEILRRLALIHDSFVGDQAGSGWACPGSRSWIPGPRRRCRRGIDGDRVTSGRPGREHHPGALGKRDEDKIADVLRRHR